MKIRAFRDADIEHIVTLFYETVHTVNRKDYSEEQLEAWAPAALQSSRKEAWKKEMQRNVTYVAEKDGILVGFADMTDAGYLDRLFVHKDVQGQGVATALVEALECKAVELGLAEIHTAASLTAKPFFERRGYRVIQSQTVERNGVALNNFKMAKSL